MTTIPVFTFNTETGVVEFTIGPEFIFIELVQVDTGHRRQGQGTYLVHQIQNLARVVDLPIELEARGDLPPDCLFDFYHNLGFEMINPDPMHRRMRWVP